MASRKVKNQLKKTRQRSFLNKDFESFKSDLLQYSRAYFSEQMTDFSDASLGGLFLEMASYVGDVMSFYLDHQFNELSLSTAVETKNVERLIRQAGVKISGASPSLVDVYFYVEAPAEVSTFNGVTQSIPKEVNLPIITRGTVVSSRSGVSFELLEDLDFSKKDDSGDFLADFKTGETDASTGDVKTYIGRMAGQCTSGTTSSEKFRISNTFVPFRKITLSSENVSEIISVRDSDGNSYYEVDALTQDTVFLSVSNTDVDSFEVPDTLEMTPAPHRFVSTTSRKTGLTSLQFGGGNAESLDNDIIPDPSEVSLPLYGDRKTFSRASIDPNSLLETRTLGTSPQNTTITVRYRSGGGLSHNVGSNQIDSISTLVTKFNSAVSATTAASIRASVQVENESAAAGGESKLTLAELRNIAVAHRNSQSRIVTKEDLIARIYTMPSNFGRVFRVAVRPNPNNPLASMLSIVSRNSKKELTISPDTLKKNLAVYLNQFRLIADAIDIVDASVVNVAVEYSVVVDSLSNKNLTLQLINRVLKEYFKIENFQIDQPIVISDLVNLILNVEGVVSLTEIQIFNRTDVFDGRNYSDISFNVLGNTDRGIVFPPSGGIFELKFPKDDICGNAV